MKRIVIIIMVLLVLFLVFECDKTKKPTHPELEDPGYYFPINFNYKWTYVHLGAGCVATGDSSSITAVDKGPRPEGTGWYLVSSGGDTNFVYRLGDTIFYEIVFPQLYYTYKLLVGPIKGGTFWKDFQYDYYIVGFEDIYSSVSGKTYQRCAKIRRTISGDTKVKYFWWVPQFGRVKEAEVNQSEVCLQGEELKRLDEPPEVP